MTLREKTTTIDGNTVDWVWPPDRCISIAGAERYTCGVNTAEEIAIKFSSSCPLAWR